MNETLTVSDLAEIDHYEATKLNRFKSCSEEQFSELEVFWSTILSNGKVEELISNGGSTKVEFAQIDSYVSSCLQAWIDETASQMSLIRQGFTRVFPLQVLNIYTHLEVEERIVGPQNLDISELKAHS